MSDPTNTELVHASGANGSNRGMVAREEFGATQLEQRAETSGTAMAALAKAATEARYSMAIMRPRRMADVRANLLADCKRPSFARVARYAKPVGKKQNDAGQWEQQFAEGFSIRFAEAAARTMGNILIEVQNIFDDAKMRISRVTVSDLENNLTGFLDVNITKTVERRQLKKGQRAIATRINSYGDTVYIVEATEDEVLVRSAALVAKARRNLILQLVPGDTLDDCLETIIEVMNDPTAVDPQAARKQVLDGFAKLNILPAQLEKHLGHPIEQCSPAQITRLRQVLARHRRGSHDLGRGDGRR